MCELHTSIPLHIAKRRPFATHSTAFRIVALRRMHGRGLMHHDARRAQGHHFLVAASAITRSLCATLLVKSQSASQILEVASAMGPFAHYVTWDRPSERSDSSRHADSSKASRYRLKQLRVEVLVEFLAVRLEARTLVLVKRRCSPRAKYVL